MSQLCEMKSGNQVGITRVLKSAIHIIASLFVPLIMVGFLILAILQMAMDGLGGSIKKQGRQGGVGGIMGEECEKEKKEEPEAEKKPEEEEKPAEEPKSEESQE